MADRQQPAEPAQKLLRRLMAEGGWSNRKLAAATEQHGRKLNQASIGNIARGDDTASADTLAYLARVMGHPETVFLEVRLARVRRLFDERLIGPDVAEQNYRELDAIFPGAAGVTRLIETVDAGGTAAAAMRRALEEAAERARDAGASSDAASRRRP